MYFSNLSSFGRLASAVALLILFASSPLALAEEDALLESCAKRRSRVLYPFVVLALNTGMRYSDLRLMQWKQVALVGRSVTVGASKTEAGTTRIDFPTGDPTAPSGRISPRRNRNQSWNTTGGKTVLEPFRERDH